MAKVRKTFSFDPEEDRDLLEWLDRQKNASEAVRNALRSALVPTTTLDDVYQAVKALEHKLGNRPVEVTATSDAPGTETAAAALDDLGL